jgi:hypothetical protein
VAVQTKLTQVPAALLETAAQSRIHAAGQQDGQTRFWGYLCIALPKKELQVAARNLALSWSFPIPISRPQRYSCRQKPFRDSISEAPMAVIPFPNPLEMHQKAPEKATAHPVDTYFSRLSPASRRGFRICPG